MKYKSLLSILLLVLVLCPSVLGFEWDNQKNYDSETRTVEIRNSILGIPFLQTDRVAEIKLNSELNVKVAKGYQKVAEFDLIYYKDDNGGLDKMDFFDIEKSMQKITREFDYKIKSYEQVSVNDYEKVCNVLANKTEQCSWEIVGTHLEEQVVWNDFNKEDLKKGEKVTIGIFTNVQGGDHIEWIPTFYGVEIQEWASWTNNFNVDLTYYYRFEELSGPVIDATGNQDMVNDNCTTGVDGIINNAYLYDGINDNVYSSAALPAANRTISLWINGTDVPASNRIFTTVDNDYLSIQTNSGQLSIFVDGTGTMQNSSGAISNSVWYHVAVTQTSGGLTITYLDGVEIYRGSGGTTGSSPSYILGERLGGENFEGKIDELGIWERVLNATEISDLYNGGAGLSPIINTNPNIILNDPTTDTNYSSPQNLTINFTAYDDIQLSNVSLYVNGILNQTNSSGINNSIYLFDLNLGDGEFIIFGQAVDNASLEANSSSVTIIIDILAPTIDVEAPNGTLNYNFVGGNETLNVTFTDTNLDTCWYNYNGTNITIDGCLSGVKNSTNFILEADNTNMTIYANDTFDNLNLTFIEWSYNLTEVSQTYPSITVESATETYTASLSYNSSKFSVITGILTLNNTQYLGTRSGTDDNATFSTDTIMPSVATETNLTAYWTVSLTDISGIINYNLTSHNVTISIINLSLCGSPLTIPFWNFTIFNESNIVEINSTFEVTFSVKQTGSIATNLFSFADTGETNSEFDFCMSPSTESYTVDTAIKLTKSGFVDKFYNYESIVVTNSTREDNLYMLATEDSTSFIVHVVDVSSTDITEAEVNVQRYYPGTGQWLTTEILTTNYVGEAIGHLLSEDADYRFNVSKGGVSIYNSSATKITCAVSPCTVTLVVPIDSASGYEEVGNLESTLVFSSSTNIFTYTYSDTSGDLSQARLYVIRMAPSNATQVTACNETKTANSGVIICDITGQLNGTYQASGYITRTSDEFLDRRIYGTLGSNIYDSMGVDGVLWSIFVFIGIIMLGASRPSLAIIFGTIGLIGLWVLQIINIGLISIVSVTAIAIILLMQVGRE